MDPEKAVRKFLKQARRGPMWWRIQARAGLALALLLAPGGAYSMTVLADAGTSEAFVHALLWLSLAISAGMWTLHAELMEGAALHVKAAALDGQGNVEPR